MLNILFIKSSLIILDSKFEQNKANFYSNAIYSSGYYFKIKKCLFFSNAPYEDWKPLQNTKGKSGVIEINEGKILIEQSYFYNNSKNMGSALAFYFNSDSHHKGEALIFNCIFENNTGVIGSAMYTRSFTKVSIYVKESFFLANRAYTGDFYCKLFLSIYFKKLRPE